MEKRATLTVEIYDPDKKAARAAQKIVLEEIYLVDGKTSRKPAGYFSRCSCLAA